MPYEDYKDYLDWLTKELKLSPVEVVVPLSDVKSSIENNVVHLTLTQATGTTIWVSHKKNSSAPGEENCQLVGDIFRVGVEKPSLFIEQEDLITEKIAAPNEANNDFDRKKELNDLLLKKNFNEFFDGRYYGQNMARPMSDLLSTLLAQKIHTVQNQTSRASDNFMNKMIRVETACAAMAFIRRNGKKYVVIVESNISLLRGVSNESQHRKTSLPGYIITVCEYMEDKGCSVDGVYASSPFFSKMLSAYKSDDLNFLKIESPANENVERGISEVKEFMKNFGEKINALDDFMNSPSNKPVPNDIEKWLPQYIQLWIASNVNNNDSSTVLYRTVLENLNYLLNNNFNRDFQVKVVAIYLEIKNGDPATKNKTILQHLNTLMTDIRPIYEKNNNKLIHSNCWIALGACLLFLTALSIIGYSLDSFELSWNIAVTALEDWATYNTATTLTTGAVVGGTIVASYYKSELNIRDDYAHARDASKAVKDQRDILALDPRPPTAHNNKE